MSDFLQRPPYFIKAKFPDTKLYLNSNKDGDHFGDVNEMVFDNGLVSAMTKICALFIKPL
jgi:hypothetical protein